INTVVLLKTSSAMEAAYGLAITITMLMTTCLMAFYLRHKGTPMWAVVVFVAVYTLIEGCFLVANIFKFFHGGWFTILIAGAVCGVMIVWHKASHIRRRYIEYRRLDRYGQILTDIHNDREIPQYASNLVYISHSDQSDLIESKILYSIIKKQPKRAQRYWILRVEYVDSPDTLTYTVRPMFDGLVWCVGMQIGFRVPPHVSVYLRQIVEHLVASGQLDLTSAYPSLRRHGIAGDFRFSIIHRIFSPSSPCGKGERMVMRLYERLRHMAVSPLKAMSLDTSNTSVECVPLIIANRPARRITQA
ncbi:MAG: KUP/HAK/KT family potassium transporter, partial [Muribaculaceae bacterium]|nr:KUP/HAK/KT family potassium transporter [Muribaculaceae bacterium]